jgi:TPR repeat protein
MYSGDARFRMFASIVVLTICSLSWNSDEQSGLPTSPATPPASRTTLSTVEIQTLKAKAEAGDAKAQLQLGAAYEDGNGVHQNDEQAVNWYRKTAEQGDAEAQNDLGIMYSLGRGVEKSKVEATKWYKRAALQRYPKAMFNMGTAYYNGDGVPVDDTTAYAWFLLAQEAGSQPAADAVKRAESEMRRFQKVEAFSKIGEMYEKGEDLRQDYVEAAKWYSRAADMGHAFASASGRDVLERNGRQGRQGSRVHLCLASFDSGPT